MATSGTVDFNLSIEEVIEDAYERCGGQARAGYDLKSARRSLNILLSEWGNRGLHFWEVANTNMVLNEGQNTYRIYWDSDASTADATSGTYPTKDNNGNHIYNATDILEVVYRNEIASPTDVSMTKIDRSTYQALANKTSTGTPSQYFVERFSNYTQIKESLNLPYNWKRGWTTAKSWETQFTTENKYKYKFIYFQVTIDKYDDTNTSFV